MDEIDFFRLGHQLHREKRYYEAWECFVMANKIVPTLFDIPAAEKLILDIRNLKITPCYTGDTGKDLIFIVGMPRSGTTLLERIINYHSKGKGSGELIEFAYIIDHFLLNKDYMIEEARSFYRKAQPAIKGKMVVDKLPRNVLSIGVIRSVFPDAKIINIRRDKFNNLMSMYTSHFEEILPYKYSWENLNIFYNQCENLLNFFEPFSIKYEDIIINFEETIKKVFKYIGLQYEPSVINFWKDTKGVKTASRDQVNKPLYSDSLYKWNPYKEFLLNF